MSDTIDARSLFASREYGKSFRNQNTIAQSVSLKGFGFWTGNDVMIQFRPSPSGSGMVFVRSDLPDQPRIPARIEFRTEKPRQLSLSYQGAGVDMVEHVLAALYGLRIDNCEIWTDQPEMPGLDGSSRLFADALNEAGIVQQPAKRPVRIVTQAFYVGTRHSYTIVTTNRQGRSQFQYTLIPEEGYPLKVQNHRLELLPETFCCELASARTFITRREADALLADGLCQRVTPHDVLVLTEEGLVENCFLYENECARHKTLDMIGDFALLGCDLIGTFESYRGGHRLNAECVRQILDKTMLLNAAEDVAISCLGKESCRIQDFFREAA